MLELPGNKHDHSPESYHAASYRLDIYIQYGVYGKLMMLNVLTSYTSHTRLVKAEMLVQ